MSVATHCIGIRGNSLCLDAYEEALSAYDNPDHRLRIEHAQVVREEDIERFARSGIIPAMQATHCTSDKDMIAERIGEERSEYAYAWRSFIDLGLPVPGGSDFPVELRERIGFAELAGSVGFAELAGSVGSAEVKYSALQKS